MLFLSSSWQQLSSGGAYMLCSDGRVTWNLVGTGEQKKLSLLSPRACRFSVAFPSASLAVISEVGECSRRENNDAPRFELNSRDTNGFTTCAVRSWRVGWLSGPCAHFLASPRHRILESRFPVHTHRHTYTLQGLCVMPATVRQAVSVSNWTC